MKAGFTQQALAERLDSAISVVSRMENGGALPSITRLVEMADMDAIVARRVRSSRMRLLYEMP